MKNLQFLILAILTVVSVGTASAQYNGDPNYKHQAGSNYKAPSNESHLTIKASKRKVSDYKHTYSCQQADTMTVSHQDRRRNQNYKQQFPQK